MDTSVLIEIGTEELPLEALDLLFSNASEAARAVLSKYRIDFKGIEFEATPRRLAFFIRNAGLSQREERSTVQGPAAEKAYDESGKPTAALEGFLRSQGIKLGQVRVQETPRGRYVTFEKVRKGEPTAKLLPRIVPEILSSISFRKTMRWEKSGFRFPRPIRWAVVLLGKKAIPFSLAAVKTGRVSRGHRFLQPEAFSIPRADWEEYQKHLRRRHVVISLEEREGMIQKGLRQKFHQRDFDTELVHETAQLVEEPFLIQGKFSGTYRDLPEEVLATCMKKYQKVFACRDLKGNLVHRFVAVVNGKRSNLNGIRRDYENVLESRLRDAQYFYDEDTKEPLEKKAGRLKELVFIGKLGTMAERTERLKELAGEVARQTGHPDWNEKLGRVAQLAKADLTAQMVGEFPELQGVMGREYAREEGEAPDVSRAIGEQYLPKNLAEDYRSLEKKISPLGALFGLCDRADLLVGAFGVRLEPSGSEDPYALRRAGGSLVKLVRANRFHLSISDLIRKSYSLYQGKLEISAEELLSKLVEFLKGRMAFELGLKAGTKAYEILQGVMKSSFDDLADVFERFETLWQLAEKQPKVFFKTSKVVERTANILKGVQGGLDSVDPSLFQDPLEKELYGLLEREEPKLKDFSQKKDYEALTQVYGELFFEPLHLFFDRVLVNVEDARLRRNRQALMKRINTLYADGVADMSLLAQVKE